MFMGAIYLLLAGTAESMDKRRRKKADRTLYERRRMCEKETCGHLVPLEAQNCVSECISPECYRKTYAEPLEDGEVNMRLGKNFMTCARRHVNLKRPPRKGVYDSAADASRAESDRSPHSRESVVLVNGVVEDAAESVGEGLDEDSADFDYDELLLDEGDDWDKDEFAADETLVQEELS
ncbi:unnamed protein product [Ascophyllum nodosum]